MCIDSMHQRIYNGLLSLFAAFFKTCGKWRLLGAGDEGQHTKEKECRERLFLVFPVHKRTDALEKMLQREIFSRPTAKVCSANTDGHQLIY